MVLLRWLLKLVVLGLFTLVFLSLFQFGPGNLTDGISREISHWLPATPTPTPTE